MEEDLTSLEVAKLLKEVGFAGNCMSYFHISRGGEIKEYNCNSQELLTSQLYDLNLAKRNTNPHYIARPTQALAQKWFRKVHNLHIEPMITHKNCYAHNISSDEDYCGTEYGYENTYEEALEKGLEQACLILKRRKEKKE